MIKFFKKISKYLTKLSLNVTFYCIRFDILVSVIHLYISSKLKRRCLRLIFTFQWIRSNRYLLAELSTNNFLVWVLILFSKIGYLNFSLSPYILNLIVGSDEYRCVRKFVKRFYTVYFCFMIVRAIRSIHFIILCNDFVEK